VIQPFVENNLFGRRNEYTAQFFISQRQSNSFGQKTVREMNHRPFFSSHSRKMSFLSPRSANPTPQQSLGLLITFLSAKVCLEHLAQCGFPPKCAPSKCPRSPCGTVRPVTLPSAKWGLLRPTPLQGLIAALSLAHFGRYYVNHSHRANPTFALRSNPSHRRCEGGAV